MDSPRALDPSMLMDNMVLNYARKGQPRKASVEVVVKNKYMNVEELAKRSFKREQKLSTTQPKGIATDFAVSALKKATIPFQDGLSELKAIQVKCEKNLWYRSFWRSHN